MSEPEISRRCTSCGASIRDSAFFCPQCGNQLTGQKPDPEPRPTSIVTAPLVEMSPESDAPKAEVAAPDQPTKPLEPKLEKPKAEKPKSEKTASQPQRIPGGNVAIGKVRGQIQRATTLARDVEGDVIHRVQKVREISTVVLDEAGYDPSLRFVLVAAALFILFLIIVLLNKFIG
jgi:zinc ribbon protein